jgi:hypothetical protein
LRSALAGSHVNIVSMYTLLCIHQMTATNCPFYGHSLMPAGLLNRLDVPFVLWRTDDNKCALVVGAYSPCRMETNSRLVDWRECPLVDIVRSSGDHRPSGPLR